MQQGQLCPGNGFIQKAGLVVVYDAASGKLAATLHPDDAIVPAVQSFVQRAAQAGPPPAASVVMALAYQHVLWSADGSRLAVTFSVDIATIGFGLYLPDGEPESVYGVAVLDASGRSIEIALGLGSAYEPLLFQGSSAYEWDLQGGEIVYTPATYPGPSGTFGVLTPALTYRWQADATPLAETAVSVAAVPPAPALGPVGNPGGGSDFTIWQPAIVTGVSTLNSSSLLTHLSGYYQLNATFAAWSPDGRYLLDAVTPQGLLALPGAPPPTPDELKAYGIDQVPLLPLRDAGLAQVLRGLNPVNPVGAAVAWRPDGHVLAAYAPQALYVPHPLAIYDCTSGRQLASLMPPALAEGSRTAALTGSTMLLRWSADGSQLMLFSLALGQVVIWGPRQLPQ